MSDTLFRVCVSFLKNTKNYIYNLITVLKMNSLPSEIMFEIVKQLTSSKDVIKCQFVSKKFYGVISSNWTRLTRMPCTANVSLSNKKIQLSADKINAKIEIVSFLIVSLIV